MRIGIAGPLSTTDLEHLLDGDKSHLPREMPGATLLVSLIEVLIRNGHEVIAFTTDPALYPRRETRAVGNGQNFTVHYVPRRRHALRSDRGARGRMLDLFSLEINALADVMKETKPDIIHAHWSYEFAAASLKSGLPHLITCHDSPWAILKLQRDLYRLGRYLIARSVLRRARNLTVVSPYLVGELRGMTSARLNVVPNPLPEAIINLKISRREPTYEARHPQLAMLLNGWSSRKNPEAGMSAMKKILAVYPAARMHLYGPDFGPEERAHEWAKARGIEDAFIFHGWTPYAKVMADLSQLDLLIHPALEESFGMTIAEAMALGVPVIAGKDSGAVPWVLGFENGGGALVDVRSPDEIARTAIDILSNSELYRKYSLQGQHRAQALFSASAIANSYLKHYASVLNGSYGISTDATQVAMG